MTDRGCELDRLVVFDTNVLEERYMAPLLRGEPLRDLLHVRRRNFTPVVMWKSVLEVLHHAKRGEPRLPWMSDDLQYPGGLQTGLRILENIPRLSSRENLYYWFGLAEEWRYKDWADERNALARFVHADDLDAAIAELDVRHRFAEWRFALADFCERIRRSIDREFRVLYSPFSDEAHRFSEYVSLVDRLGSGSLLPNEDLEILCGAIFQRARAFVTNDSAILHETALSLGLGHGIALLHPDRLERTAEEDFEVRWSPDQVSPRSR